MKPSRLLVPLLIAGLVAVLSWLWLPTAGPVASPDITLKSIDGRAIALKDLRGRPVLVTFWATTCPTCLKEMPHLADLYRELSPRGLEIIGIAMYHDPPNRVLALHKSRGIPYPVALDIEAEAARAFDDVRITPIVYRNSGVMNLENVRRKVLDMIAKHRRTAPESGTGETG